MKSQLQDALSKNRAEELGYDVWEHYVVPHFFNRLDLNSALKPRIIIGGRGCGKTMLLRYHCHQTVFSQKRTDIPMDAISNIGLYWRADTQFCSAMTSRGIDDDIWIAAFNHFAAIMLSIELLNSLSSIANSNYGSFSHHNLTNFNFTKLKAYDQNIPGSFSELQDYLESRLWDFESWVNDVRKHPEPSFLPGRSFILSLIKLILRSDGTTLANACFYVYFDEYENLLEYQQKTINTWLKHSEQPLIMHLAMKRGSFLTTSTLGPESLSDIHDYRIHDLEEYLHTDDSFTVFAAEILFLALSFSDYGNIPIDVSSLRNPALIAYRHNPDYKKSIIASAQSLFPDLSHDSLADLVFSESALKSKLIEKTKYALKCRQSNLDYSLFINEKVPKASIVIPALLHRKRLTPENILQEFNLLLGGGANKFTDETSWVQNNFIGCLLQLYAPNSRPCAFYSGFKTFCKLSRGNLRHFLELCHKSLKQSFDIHGTLITPVDPIKQAEAARQTSVGFLGEIRSFGKYGNRLHTFVLRLGSLFALAHKRPSQSETEQSHFSVRSGTEDFSLDDHDFIKEAIKWSVLFEHTDTKRKGDYQVNSVEYVLNPIYTPYFFISYRKKRRLELSSNDAICLIRGSLSQYTTVLKRFSKTWGVDTEDLSPSTLSLFDWTDK